MSRVGKSAIPVPDGVDVKVHDGRITVKGPKGELSWSCPQSMNVRLENKKITVERQSDSKPHRSLHGTTRSLIANMVEGTSKGFTRVLEISGIGYRAQVQGQKITFTLGHSHPIEFHLPEGVTAQVDKKQTQLTIEGIDNHLLGQVAANIRSLRPPNVYKGKGVRYANEVIKLKVGKAGK